MAIILTGMLAEADNTGAAVQMIGAQTQSMLFFDQVHARNPSGVALNATAARVGADLRLGPGFETYANTSVAAVRLAHAHEVRSLRIDQVLVTNTQAAPVLDLTEATVDGPLWFRLVA